MSDNEYDRPLLVTIIAIFYGLLGVLMLLGGIGMLFLGGVNLEGVSGVDAETLGTIGGGVMLVMGLVYLVLCYGFLKGWSIMWYLGVIFAVIGLIMNIASIVMGGPAAIIGILVEVIILLYLFKKNVKLFFLKHE